MRIKFWRWGFIIGRFAIGWTTQDHAREFERWELLLAWLDKHPVELSEPKRMWRHTLWIGRSHRERFEGVRVGFFKGLRRAREYKQMPNLYRQSVLENGKVTYHDYIGSPSGRHSAFCWCPLG
jgi:hypothetical protein